MVGGFGVVLVGPGDGRRSGGSSGLTLDDCMLCFACILKQIGHVVTTHAFHSSHFARLSRGGRHSGGTHSCLHPAKKPCQVF
jgi:hypothetical protein